MNCSLIQMEQQVQEISQIIYPCAACKIQHRKCGDKCVLAPYFPPNDRPKFLVVHKIFGASNIVRILKGIPVEKRADAVSSMVYEASARVQDPIYGCAGAVCRLQNQISHLQSQMAITQAELVSTQATLMSLATGFFNGAEVGSALGVTQDVVQHMDDIIVLQDDQDFMT